MLADFRQDMISGASRYGAIRAASMISFVSGDILQANEQYIAEGVAEGNQDELGTGLAPQHRRHRPSYRDPAARRRILCQPSSFTVTTRPLLTLM